MVKTDYDPQELQTDKLLFKIKEEQNERPISALLLSHGLIETYLLEIIISHAGFSKKECSKKIISNIERIGFNNLLHINLMLGNISAELYEQINSINKKRNKIVHELLGLDLNSQKTKNKINRQINKAREVCKKLQTIYIKAIDKKAKEIIKN